MKFTTKLGLLLKLVLVLLLVGALFTYLNYTMSRKPSREATIESNKVQVGSPMSGTIVDIRVKERELVTKGETLASIQGPEITAAIKDTGLSKDAQNDSIRVVNKDRIELLALQDGIVDNLSYAQGSYVTTNDAIMTINQVADQYVVASFRLSPPDYAKVSDNTKLRITLPDNTTLDATLTDISLKNDPAVNNDILTVITAKPTSNADALSRFPVGTPVRATLILNQDTWYKAIKNYVYNLFQPKD